MATLPFTCSFQVFKHSALSHSPPQVLINKFVGFVEVTAQVTPFTQQLLRYREQGRNGVNCPAPSAPRGPPWWQIFALNKILVWKIAIHKRYKNTNIYSDLALSISVWSNYRPADRMCLATQFSVAPRSIQEKSSNLKLVQQRVRLHLSYWIACAG